MVKYLLGVLTGVLIIFFLVIAVIIVGALAAGGGQSGVPNDAVLTLDLSGALPENVASPIQFDFLHAGPPATLLTVRRAVERAAKDERIKALALDCGGLGAGWGKVAELRDVIAEFKKSGKPVLAYMEVAGTIDFLVASAADEIHMAPEGRLDMKGLRAEVAFYKDTFEKIGVEAELEWVGKYKSAVEPYSRDSMSDAFREVVESQLDGLLELLVEMGSSSRGLTPEQFRAALDQGPFLSPQAKELGLVDQLSYPDQFEDRIKEKVGLDEIEMVSLRRYNQASLSELDLGSKRKIAVVYGVGTIVGGMGDADPFFGSELLAGDAFVDMLDQVRKDEDLEAVIVRIDSPGGDALASDRMWRALQLLREEKPVIISMSDVAASGGYYMAMAKDTPILAYPGTYTGSIGVYFGKFNLRGLYDKIGLRKEILTRGKFASIDTDYRSLTDDERTKLREGVEAVYDSFVSKVADARGKSWDEINEVAQGRVWLGKEGLGNGLVDELGGYERAIALAKEKAGIGADEEVALATYPKAKTILEVLFEHDGMGAQGLASAPLFPASWAERFDPQGLLPALAGGGMLAVTPYSWTIR
ncbi:MAG: signal peptide peptidase SppA [Acidobacteria bacterium]|nr:signal peptide peptidase SppA [Acidobacteriota bacterium]